MSDTITITNVGNVEENNVALSSSLSSGLALTGPSPCVARTRAIDHREHQPHSRARPTPLNTILEATLTATFGPQSSPLTQSTTLGVNVVVPGATAIAAASVAANQLGDTSLAARLSDLSTALTNLVENPTSTGYAGQAQAALGAVISQLSSEPSLSSFAGSLTADGATLANATTASAVQSAVTSLGNDLGTLSQTLTDLAAHGFELSFLTNSEIGRPQVATTYQLMLRNDGSQITTYNLSLGTLPAGVNGIARAKRPSRLRQEKSLPAHLARPVLTVSLTSTSATELSPFDFTVTATAQGAPELSQTITGAFTVRTALVQVISVTTNPAFTLPGATVDVQAKILNAVNTQQQATVFYTVTDSGGATLFTSTAVPTTLNVLTTLSTVDLGSFDTTGFALGQDTITVNVTRRVRQSDPRRDRDRLDPDRHTRHRQPLDVPPARCRKARALSPPRSRSTASPLSRRHWAWSARPRSAAPAAWR